GIRIRSLVRRIQEQRDRRIRLPALTVNLRQFQPGIVRQRRFRARVDDGFEFLPRHPLPRLQRNRLGLPCPPSRLDFHLAHAVPAPGRVVIHLHRHVRRRRFITLRRQRRRGVPHCLRRAPQRRRRFHQRRQQLLRL